MRWLALWLAGAGASLGSPAGAAEPGLVFSATFAYQDYPKDLWRARLARLKALGFNAVEVPPADHANPDRAEALRLARQAGLRILEHPPAPLGDCSLIGLRQALAAGAKAMHCPEVLEGRSWSQQEAAISLAGEARPAAMALARHGALLRHSGRLLGALEPHKRPAAALILPSGQKPPGGLRLTRLASASARGPAFLSAIHVGQDRPVTGTLSALDPRSAKPILLRSFHLPPRQALLLPLNLALAQPEVCAACSSFAPDERIVSATAELLSVTLENGLLAMEFVAPGQAELVLELARQPHGPVVAGGRLRNLEWDEKTRTARLVIPPGQPPDFRSRVGLGIETPETYVFLQAPPRLILGSTARVTGVFSSVELAARSRLLAPAGWRVKPQTASGAEMAFSVETPVEAWAEETATLAVEVDGKIAQSATLPVTPPFSLRIEPAEALHLRPDAPLPIRPHLATLVLPRRRTYQVYLRNHHPEIRTFRLAASGPGLRISPASLEVPAGAGLERELTFSVSLLEPRPGLYRWDLEVRDGDQSTRTPLLVAALSPDEPLTYQLDLDRDGHPEWVLENQNARLAISPRHGGRSTEFLLKEPAFNAFTARGALQVPGAMEARALGPGSIELRAGDLVRRVTLAPREAAFEIEQTGGPPEWTLGTASPRDPKAPRLKIVAPQAQVDASAVRFPEGAPRRARFAIESP